MGKTTLGMGKGSPLDARKLLDMHFLDIRSALLETAAALDRIERAKGGKEVMGDSRISKLFAACRIITDTGATDRAERFLTLFSSPETGPLQVEE